MSVKSYELRVMSLGSLRSDLKIIRRGGPVCPPAKNHTYEINGRTLGSAPTIVKDKFDFHLNTAENVVPSCSLLSAVSLPFIP